MYDVVEVSVLGLCCSDHNPLLVVCSNSKDQRWWKSRMFKYEASWIGQNEHGEIINKVWQVKQQGVNP
jgi:hypothetical protein